ncbi:RNA polymerase factor sigma-32 [Alphaproteobacteria bacterium]|nr:RNA polymerase factor sigma-32 [Alphaproteobacteria bacterium]
MSSAFVAVEDNETKQANKRYIKHAMGVPLLEKDREHTLAKAWRDDGDEKALHKLVEPYARLAISMAFKYKSYGLPMGDLIQEANVGLMQAAARFDPYREVRFSTYGSWWMRAAIQEFILRNWSIVRMGTTSAQKTLFFNLRRLRAKIERTGEKVHIDQQREQVANDLKVPLRDVVSMERRLDGPDQSLNASVSDTMASELQDLIVDERPNPEILISGVRDSELRSEILREAMAGLTPREYTIIQKRRLVDDGATLESLGKIFGVSKERVRQLENRALTKLKDNIALAVDRPSDLY